MSDPLLSVRVEDAKQRLLLATAAIGGTRRDSELAAHIDALILAVREEQNEEKKDSGASAPVRSPTSFADASTETLPIKGE